MPGMAHLRGEKYQDIMLIAGASAEVPKGLGVEVNFLADNIDLLTNKVRKANADIVEGPVIRPWNVKELVVRDIF
ncbi:hypothetical protein E5161_13025 [Cohnella pontilimi]|uniref:Uncharacterized protein n=1 Tax=Cohnella pontilimi TaxID=2564100 RepID=A0A4U0F9Q2_9BACL|nr:hypothetical protein [Cohnella pontilimi]TJY41340.1 hypothetical protein E5161_13025 [Cohnella pontilimi]